MLTPALSNAARDAMTAVELLIRGTLTGLIIAAPVGPVNVICIQRTVQKGWRAGVLSGLGSAAADTIYGAIAAFSISLVIQFLIREEFWIRLCGGILLVAIGAWYYVRKPAPMQTSGGRSASKVASTFVLTLTNPTTVLSFLIVLSAMGLAQRRTLLMSLIVVGGIFIGSMLWWVILCSIVNRFRRKFNERSMVWLNRIGGLAIAGFGILSIVLAKRPRV